MAKILVQRPVDGDPANGWDDGDAFDTTAKAKAALRGSAPGEYRIVQVKWRGKVAPKDDTIITRKA